MTARDETEGPIASKAAPGQPSAVGGGADAASTPPRHRRRGRAAIAVSVVAGVVVVAAGLAASGALGGDGDGTEAAAPSGPSATAEVRRTTLTRTETVTGELGYGEVFTLQATASSGPGGETGPDEAGGDDGGAGIVTWVPGEATIIRRGEAVYRVDEQDVPLLYGDIPLYRTLQEGMEGGDVRMLEENLAELGYDGFTVDEEYTAKTASAVEEWQDDLGRERTGTVATGDAVVASGARRVAEVLTLPGALLSGNLLTWSGTERLVTVALDVQLEDLVEVGTTVTVTLPDDTTVEAEVTDIGTPTTPDGGAAAGGGEGGGQEEPTLPVEMRVGNQERLGRYQAAEVEVTLKAETRENVLAVPVTALVGRPEGGYAVESVAADGTVEYLSVEVGMFADSLVEVSGEGIMDGTLVGVPQ